jgi:hypothetical protein
MVDGDKQLNIARITKFFHETKPFLISMELDELTNAHQQSNESYQDLLSQFFAVRSELLSLIDSASTQIKNKQAIHTIFGPTSFSEIVEFIAIHDRKHIQQSSKLLNRL